MFSVRLFGIGIATFAAITMVGCMSVNGKPGSTAETTADLVVSPLSFDFGSVAQGTVGQQTVNIANTGTMSAKITSAALTGAGFTVKELSVPLIIAAGESASFLVQFAPGSAGDASGSVALASNIKGAPITVRFKGEGTNSSIAVTPSSASFGDVVVGKDATQKVELKASGSADVKITKLSTTGTGFSVSGLTVPLTLKPGATASLTAAFKPSGAVTESGFITITSTAPDSPLTIGVSGKGISRVSNLSITPASLNFGSVAVGKATSKEVTVKSTGNSDVEISSVSISGAGFSVIGGEKTTLSPGEQLALTVKFKPPKSGSASGNVTIASNASNSTGKVSLSGSASNSSTSSTQTNEDVTQHIVTLQWDGSIAPEAVGYYVYRGTRDGSYKKISPTIAGTSFADMTVTSGQNLVYVVTAVDSNGVESGFSNPVTVTVPKP